MELSIIEFVVYALICYSGIVMLIASAFKSEGTGSTQNSLKIIWLIPSMICASLLAQVGGNVSFGNATNIITNNSTSTVITESTNFSITLQNPVWVTVHWLFFIILLIYVIINILTLLTKLK